MDFGLLVISAGKSLITDSIISGLKEAGINCESCGYYVKEISSKKESSDIILLIAGDLPTDVREALVFIKDICMDDDKMLYIIGYESEIERINEVIPKVIVKKSFLRPLDAKQTVKDIALDANEAGKKKGAKKILIVDDDITFLKMVKKWLSGRYSVTVVKSGMQAIQYLTGHKPDLILMDYDMPITTGSKVLEMIRSEEDTKDIPVIFLTGKADKDTVLQVMSLKPQGYLLKSMPQAEIVSSVDRFFETEKWHNAAVFSEY